MTETSRYPHLNGDAAVAADMDNNDRIKYMYADRYVPYSRADNVMSELEFLMGLDDAIRPQGRLLVGSSLSGKTTILREFLKNHPADDNLDGEAVKVPVLYVPLPESPKDSIYYQILGRLGVQLPSYTKFHVIRETALKLMRDIGMRVLIVDEVGNLLEGSKSAQRLAMNTLKAIMNEIGRPLVAAGTEDALQAIRTDQQILSRLAPIPLQPFKCDKQFSLLLAGFEMMLPLRVPSNFGKDSNLVRKVHLMTGGVIGNVSDLLNRAAEHAIKSGIEYVDEEILDKCSFARYE